MVYRVTFIALYMISNRKHGTLTIGATSDPRQHSEREKSFKKYQRDWRNNLIKRDNPHWNDVHMRHGF